MQMRPMRAVYRLREDREQVAAIQRATLETEDFGIEPTHGLVGSEEWWSKIESGELPVITVCGTITRVYMGSMRDWPMFEVSTASGETSEWTREANSVEQSKEYVKGRAAEIDYVIQRHRAKSHDGGGETKVVLEIRVEETA